MLNFTVRNLLNACINTLDRIDIYKIRKDVHTAYDPIEDTELIYSGEYMIDIDRETLESEVQDFYVNEYRNEIIINI